jgi:hypothetical protein
MNKVLSVLGYVTAFIAWIGVSFTVVALPVHFIIGFPWMASYLAAIPWTMAAWWLFGMGPVIPIIASPDHALPV